MSDGLDVERLRRVLESRLQFPLISSNETVDGGVFSALRPAFLELGNGFAIVLARTHRQFEASFKADNFAGGLLRTMSEAGDSERKEFFKTRSAIEASGIQVYLAVNGDAKPDCICLREKWSEVEIDVSKRLSSAKTPGSLIETAIHVTSACLSLVLTLVGSDKNSQTAMDGSIIGLPEGAKTRVEINRYERSPANRAACIDHYGLTCQSCGFDFLDFYGEQGEGYIEVHHLTPVSKLGPDYVVDPVHDLIPLCSNCHSMVHRKVPPMPVEELRSLVTTRRGRTSTS